MGQTGTMTFQENIPLAPLTTIKVGGAARYFAEATSEDQVREAADLAKRNQWPLFILGGGSNLVVADRGWPGLVLKISIVGIERHAEGFAVGAGVEWDHFVAEAVAQNCSGIECLSGIPGSVGATPVQNVGAYGQEVSDTIDSVVVFDLKADTKVTLSNHDCGFAYRTSIFNTTERGRYVILRVAYRLTAGGNRSLKYADLRKHFSSSTKQPSLSEVREAVRQIRRRKGMLIVPEDDERRSVGSFFKNPVLSEAQLHDVDRRAESRGLQIPSYPALASQHKISAAWLVEHAGFSRGYTLGAARISHKHALALVNRGDAYAADIMRLKDKIQEGVERAWGILLEPEPVFVGF